LLSDVVGLLVGSGLAWAAYLGKVALQRLIFFDPYEARDHTPIGEPKSAVLLAMLRSNGAALQRAERLQQPLVDRDLDRRRYIAWLLDPAWVLAVFGCLAIGLAATRLVLT
jgi:hypothetical protein